MTLSASVVRKMKPGTMKTFKFSSPKECRNAQLNALRDARWMGYKVKTVVNLDSFEVVVFKISNNGK